MNQLFDTAHNSSAQAYGLSESTRLVNYYISQIAIQLKLIERLQGSVNHRDLIEKETAWLAIQRYDARLLELAGGES